MHHGITWRNNVGLFVPLQVMLLVNRLKTDILFVNIPFCTTGVLLGSYKLLSTNNALFALCPVFIRILDVLAERMVLCNQMFASVVFEI